MSGFVNGLLYKQLSCSKEPAICDIKWQIYCTAELPCVIYIPGNNIFLSRTGSVKICNVSIGDHFAVSSRNYLHHTLQVYGSGGFFEYSFRIRSGILRYIFSIAIIKKILGSGGVFFWLRGCQSIGILQRVLLITPIVSVIVGVRQIFFYFSSYFIICYRLD